MNKPMLAGIVCGLAVGIILVVIILKATKTNNKIKAEYDERQEKIRGKGFKYAFFTLFIFDACYGLIDMAAESQFADVLAVQMAGIVLSVLVYAGYAIWHDCYFALNENPVKVMSVFGILSLANFILAGLFIANGMIVQDGRLTLYCVNLIAGLMFLIICAMLGTRVLARKREEREM